MSTGQPSSLAPFACRYSAQVPELLRDLRLSLAISTYQAGKVIFISAKDEHALVQLPRTFDKPMGIALRDDGSQMALATRNETVLFSNSPDLAVHYPKAPGKYDALFLPRLTYHTGPLDIHDLSFGNGDQLFAVNTLFSCLVRLDPRHNFVPHWNPPFIDQLVSEDRCHLNGMALQNGEPKYVTAFNTGNRAQSWREHITTSGVVMDVDSGEVVAGGLAMPHTPRIYQNELFVLLSATGELVKIDVATGKYDVVTQIGGFVRGMSWHRDYLFVGLSKLRKNSSTFAKLEFAKDSDTAGIQIIHLPTGSKAGEITYLRSLDEIYDVHVMPNMIRPNILNTTTPDHLAALMTPESNFWARPSQTTT